MEVLSLVSDDGAVLAARFYGGEGIKGAVLIGGEGIKDAVLIGGEGIKGAVLIGGAMGVKQDYYAAFARWLATQGFAVMTFDYRGMGGSRSVPHTKSLRGLDADLFAWARDYDTAIDALRGRAPAVPLYLIGHSLGAQLPGLLRNRDRIDGLLSVAAGSGYWRDNAPQLKRIVLYFWHVLVPVATALFGYFPGKRIGKVGDLPRGVILQWRRWCLDARRIGHFGFFRDQFQSSLWQRSVALLQGFNNPKEMTA